MKHNGLVHGIFLRNLKISPCFVNILLFESINIYCELEVLVEVWVEVLLDDLCLDDLMRAGQQVHPHEWVALAKRVHLLEALALHHRNIETACRVVIANLKLILFLCVLFDFLIYPCTQFTLKSDYYYKKIHLVVNFAQVIFKLGPRVSELL